MCSSVVLIIFELPLKESQKLCGSFFAHFLKKYLTNLREPCIMHTYSKGFDEEDAKRTNKEK